jgi:Xaa-Pro aminopeptidase
MFRKNDAHQQPSLLSPVRKFLVSMNEFKRRLQTIRTFLNQHQLDALLLQRISSFAWATCGAASYINIAASQGTAVLLITANQHYLLTDNIEAERLAQEENLAAQGWEFVVHNWYEPASAIERLASGLRLSSDSPFPQAIDLNHDLARLRAQLSAEEMGRFRALGQLTAAAMQSAIDTIQPGQSELQIAARLGAAVQAQGALPIVNLIAADERIYKYRHPLPTTKKLERYAMLVLCARQFGLVCSLTRLVHFGALPDDLRRRATAVARIDAAYISATRPGVSLADIFKQGQKMYAQTGYGDEWRFHHQGGAAGYEPREYLGAPAAQDVVRANQAFAWNPSVAGAKSEDTILVGATANEMVTAIAGWPVQVYGTVARPMILEL